MKEAIILAGGLGTRLRSAVPHLPKCMAPVNGKPFLAYIVHFLQMSGIQKFIFSLGYKHEEVVQYFALHYPKLPAEFVIEDEPLYTGGAIKLSSQKATDENVIIVNGDTLFCIHLPAFANFHLQKKAVCTLALKPMKHFERYGVVTCNHEGRIESFKEKQWYEEGFINGGLYALNLPAFLNENLPNKFSFEKDYLEKFYKQRKLYAFVEDAYFIDIGIPEDYRKAQNEISIEWIDKCIQS